MQLHFFSGLPRSGSTLLAAILNQNPALHVSTTSSLINILDGLASTWAQSHLLNVRDPERKQLATLMRAVIAEHYRTRTDRPVVLDKSRGWPSPVIMHGMQQVLGRPPRIVATVRNVEDCAASFVRLAKPADLGWFLREGQLISHLKSAYLALQEGYKARPSNFLFVEYEDLLSEPREQLRRVEQFLGLPAHEYDLTNIDATAVEEDDEELHGFAGMHLIRPVLGRVTGRQEKSTEMLLGPHLRKFQQPAFWRGDLVGAAGLTLLDTQLAAGTMGDFDEGWRIAVQLAKECPEDDRAAFNRGWYLLRQGKLLEGMRDLDRGRREEVFGNKAPTGAPLWDGKTPGKTALLALEGGLGDQIHQVRYAINLMRAGLRTVVACAPELVPLFKGMPHVSAFVATPAAEMVYHECWVPGMSAPLHLGLEYKDICGGAYLPRPMRPYPGPRHRPRIGLRWSGNPAFEHHHHKRFPPQMLFDAVLGLEADFISLQRDHDLEHRPEWVREVPLGTWEQTRDAVAGCDLVLTACTSVSHLSGALGVNTWVILPVMAYYLYAPPGERTVYYDSMRLFRQEKFDDWTAPFAAIREALKEGFPHAAVG